ncbi:hypothetical protein DFH11DRAFT_1877615 [Phellopilus nigrolimitatus]|nr:hypothetical protein DFH11DRAFT_1877615 [Phellopilus nigrolimitatus]
MPVILTKRVLDNHLKRAEQLFARDGDGNDDGGLKQSTKTGIAIGLICLFALLLGFYAVSQWRRQRPPPTSEDIRANETLDRWLYNVSHPAGKHSRHTHDNNRPTRRDSASTSSTLASLKDFRHDEHDPLPPPHAYMGTRR